MTAAVQEIAAALGAAVENVTTPLNQSMRYLPYLSDNFSPPVVLVAVETTKPHLSFGGGRGPYEFTLSLILPRTSDRSALQEMETYMCGDGPTSVSAAVEADQTLGGLVQTLVVTECGPLDSVKIGTSDVVYIHIPFKTTVYP